MAKFYWHTTTEKLRYWQELASIKKMLRDNEVSAKQNQVELAESERIRKEAEERRMEEERQRIDALTERAAAIFGWY